MPNIGDGHYTNTVRAYEYDPPIGLFSAYLAISAPPGVIFRFTDARESRKGYTPNFAKIAKTETFWTGHNLRKRALTSKEPVIALFFNHLGIFPSYGVNLTFSGALQLEISCPPKW